MNIKISISLFYKCKIATLRNRLLLTKSDYLFAFFQFFNSLLSSRNRSNSKAFHQIMPCVASVCEGMHYHKTGVPWQTKSIFIIVLFLLNLSRNALPRLSSRSRQSQNARLCKHIGTLCSLLRVFCKGFRGYDDMLWKCKLWQIRAELSKLLLPVSSKIGSNREWVTTKGFVFYSSKISHKFSLYVEYGSKTSSKI